MLESLTTLDWILASSAAFILGISKSGLKGIVKASLFFTQFKNQLILDYEEKQIYRGTDSIYASAVRFGNESHRYLS